MKRFFKLIALILSLALSISVFAGCGDITEELFGIIDIVTDFEESYVIYPDSYAPPSDGDELQVSEDGVYTSPEDVALYISIYGKLPSNYITKSEASTLGWDSSKGNLWDVAPGKSIGGDRFGNYEGLLPKASGRQYYECDVNYDGGYRGSERIVFSNDGLVYYTADHYDTFVLMYKNGEKQ